MSLTFIDIAFLIYMFISLYMLSLLVFIYISNRKKMFSFPSAKFEPVSIIVPCYNEASTIGKTIESLLKLNYPKNMFEIIVVDDRSSDNSAEIVRSYEKKYLNVKLIVNSRNSGGAAEPTNIGIKASKFDYIAVTDADSSPEPDALKKMLGFLQREKDVAAVTCAVLTKPPTSFIQRLQEIEYVVIAFGRKLLDFIDSVYVTPGPFALYRKSALVQVGLFDTKNLTQDIEIVWRLISQKYKTRMCLSARVYSETPTKVKAWFKQRLRWNIGGTQTIIKYKKLFLRKNMLGYFILPFFAFSLLLGLFGLSLFTYLLIKRFLFFYLSTKYSILAQTAIVTLQDLTFAPSILNFLGVALFLLGGSFTIFAVSTLNSEILRKKNIFSILFYLIVYLAIYPVIMIVSLYKLLTKTYSW